MFTCYSCKFLWRQDYWVNIDAWTSPAKTQNWKSCQMTKLNTIYCIYILTRVALYKCSENLPEIRSFWFETFLSLWKPQQCKVLSKKKRKKKFHNFSIRKVRKWQLLMKKIFVVFPFVMERFLYQKAFFNLCRNIVTKRLSGKANSLTWKKSQRGF